MYRVLVVEDVDITREDIMALIEWEKYGFELLPGARNGKIGLEYAMRYQPDIILTDIKMPVMTGLDMIGELRAQKHKAKVILLTAYEEFGLAKRALEMNVQSFILKYEIDRDMLLAELNKMVEMIEKERKIENITLYHGLEKLLEHAEEENYIDEQYFTWIGESMLLDVWRGNGQIEISEENLIDLLKAELAEYRFISLKISASELILFLRMPDVYSELQRREYVRIFIVKVQNVFREKLDAKTAVAIGGIIRNNRDIAKCRKKATEYLARRIFYKDSCILEENQELLREQKEHAAANGGRVELILEEIRKDMRNGAYPEAGEKIRNLFEKEMVKQQDLSFLSKVVVKLSYFFREKGYEAKIAEFDEYLEQVRVRLLKESIYQTEERFLYLLDILKEYSDRQYSRKIQDTIAFMREHFNEDLGLNEAADKMGVTPIYLSHLFRKETGLTFSAYLTKLRIERAKELLREGDKKIYEISEMVGYQTVQYFSKVFKKETGKTPKEFE